MKTIATTFCDFETLIKNHIYVDRGYASAYGNDSRPGTLVGVKFDPKVRNITIPKIEPL